MQPRARALAAQRDVRVSARARAAQAAAATCRHDPCTPPVRAQRPHRAWRRRACGQALATGATAERRTPAISSAPAASKLRRYVPPSERSSARNSSARHAPTAARSSGRPSPPPPSPKMAAAACAARKPTLCGWTQDARTRSRKPVLFGWRRAASAQTPTISDRARVSGIRGTNSSTYIASSGDGAAPARRRSAAKSGGGSGGTKRPRSCRATPQRGPARLEAWMAKTRARSCKRTSSLPR
mmetsp:Transcript_10674/g.29176  ORF Transcript_10674/g.29176 Transcript_10674/m.29176 type:complete len:241 (-) Transcript_10674:589-1311(-)